MNSNKPAISASQSNFQTLIKHRNKQKEAEESDVHVTAENELTEKIMINERMSQLQCIAKIKRQVFRKKCIVEPLRRKYLIYKTESWSPCFYLSLLVFFSSLLSDAFSSRPKAA